MSTSDLLSLPKDIPWSRLAFSTDMFDETLDAAHALPPKWLTSVAVFGYVVPDEESRDLYPDSRLVYLRVVSSLTGVNLIGSSALLTTETFAEDREELERDLDDFQVSTLDKLVTGLRPYWPCGGAILQVAVYPPRSAAAQADLWDYPYIQDFEPKKREFYETVNRSGEVLSGSKAGLNLKKGLTTADKLEESDLLTGVSVKAGGWGFSAEASATGKWGTEHTGESEQSETRTTDTAREKRETQSYTTAINQMYQPLLSYHLGTNRAVWVLSPRPHTVDSENTLVKVYGPQGEVSGTDESAIGRALEGIQDMFLVVNVPRTSEGLCLQVTLDTGYDLGTWWSNQVIVLRRTVESCARIDGDRIRVERRTTAPDAVFSPLTMLVVAEAALPANVTISARDVGNPDRKRELVFRANERSRILVQRMLDASSSGISRPRPFVETETFRLVVDDLLARSTYPLDRLVETGTLTADELAALHELGLRTVADVLRHDADRGGRPDRLVAPVRQRLLDSAHAIGRRIVDLYARR